MIVSLLVALSTLALSLGLAGSAGAQTAGGPVWVPVNWGAPQMRGALLLKYEMWERGTPLGLGRNVATFWGTYKGKPFMESAPSSGLPWVQGGHAEEQTIEALKASHIPLDDIRYGYSDLGPCELISSNCMAVIRALPGIEEFYYKWPYPAYSPTLTPAQNARNWAIRRLSVMEMREQNMQLRNTFERSRGMWNPGCEAGGGGSANQNGLEGGALRAQRVSSRTALVPTGTGCGPDEGEGSEDGALPEELGDPAEALDPGGIDFSSLQLRYLSLSGPHQDDLHYSMDSDGAPVTTNPGTGLQTAQEDSNAFFTWLTLPASTFWVNLSPNSPPQIIDPRLALTDAGRVMLQSDLLLKEAGVAAENPATPTGAQYWPPFLSLPLEVTRTRAGVSRFGYGSSRASRPSMRPRNSCTS